MGYVGWKDKVFLLKSLLDFYNATLYFAQQMSTTWLFVSLIQQITAAVVSDPDCLAFSCGALQHTPWTFPHFVALKPQSSVTQSSA